MLGPDSLQTGDYRNPRRESTQSPVDLGDAALAYSRNSIPVFPCKPGGKSPLTPNGFKDATTDPEKIRRWWSKWPNANIGIPTGAATGVLVLDVDDLDALDRLEAGHGELPKTRTHSTGSGGMHVLFEYPAGETLGNSTGGLPGGIHVRGEGGYVVAPPSRTTGPYEVLDRVPAVGVPEWLLGLLRRPSAPAQSNVGMLRRTGIDVGLDGPTIPHGGRNWTLYRIACRLRAQGLERGEILEELHHVYEARCEKSEPMEAGELEKIAHSAAKHAPGKAHPEVSPEVLDALDAIEADIMRRDWPGVGGKSERDAKIAIVRVARMRGTMIPAGVRVSAGVRTLALLASVSKSSLLDNVRGGEKRPGTISRLKMRGEVRSDNGTRHAKDAGAFVLPFPRATVDHSTTRGVSIEPGVTCGPPLRAPLTAPRLRWSRPIFAGPERVGTVSRLGKSKGEIIDQLEAAGGTLAFEELAEKLGTARTRDLRRRHLEPLAEAGVVECSGDAVALTGDWRDALDRRREEDGEIADHRRDADRYKREGEAYRENRPVERAPTQDEMRERRENAPDRRRRAIEEAVSSLFATRPEYRGRRVGQIVCALHDHLPDDFPRGRLGHPKDREVEAILDGEGVAA